jgi:hypothetical protein
LAASIPWNRFLGSLYVYEFGLREKGDNKHEKRCQYRICRTIMMTNEPRRILDITEREARRLRLYVVGRKHSAIL